MALLASRRVLLVLASPAMVISSAEKYALLGRLLSGPPCSVPLDGTIAGPSIRRHRPPGGRAVPGLPGHPGAPQ